MKPDLRVFVLGIMMVGFLYFGCIDLSGFLQERAEEVFSENQETVENITQPEPEYTEVENLTTDKDETEAEEISKPKKEESNESKVNVECPPEYNDVYITKEYDPYYCTINMAVAKHNITICESIPLSASESLDRCIRVLASTYGKDPKWCEENLYREESIEMCKRFVMFGHKRETY